MNLKLPAARQLQWMSSPMQRPASVVNGIDGQMNGIHVASPNVVYAVPVRSPSGLRQMAKVAEQHKMCCSQSRSLRFIAKCAIRGGAIIRASRIVHFALFALRRQGSIAHNFRPRSVAWPSTTQRRFDTLRLRSASHARRRIEHHPSAPREARTWMLADDLKVSKLSSFRCSTSVLTSALPALLAPTQTASAAAKPLRRLPRFARTSQPKMATTGLTPAVRAPRPRRPAGNVGEYLTEAPFVAASRSQQ
jgi:hypothetical protein